MTTHYMEEADRLCDRLAIIDHGKLLALDTPAGLKARAPGGTLVEITLDGEAAACSRGWRRCRASRVRGRGAVLARMPSGPARPSRRSCAPPSRRAARRWISG